MKVIRPATKQNFGSENLDLIDFTNIINSNSAENAFIELIKNIFIIPENNTLSINNNTGICLIYKDGIWINSNWKDIFNYLYNRYVFFLKDNFQKIKESLNIEKIKSYNLFFHLGLKNNNIDGINKEIYDFFSYLKN
jgi:hypothetical protein